MMLPRRERAQQNPYIDVDRVAAEVLSSTAYGSLPRLSRPGCLGPEVRLSPFSDVTGFQWASRAGRGEG